MPKFEVTLASQTDEQSRRVTLSALDADDAARLAANLEAEYCAYRYDDDPYLTLEARALVESDRYGFREDGKVFGPNKRLKAKFHQQHQVQPYKVIDVIEQKLDPAHVGRLVRELAGLTGKDEEWAKVLVGLQKQGIPLAAVTAFMYGVPVQKQYDGSAVVDFDTDTIKVALTTSSYTENQDTHDFFNDVTNEVTGTGYTAGGATLGSKAVTYDTASDQARMDAADTTWTTSTITARKAVVYKDTGSAATSPLMGLIDFGADVSTTAGTFQITWDSTGIIVIDVT